MKQPWEMKLSDRDSELGALLRWFAWVNETGVRALYPEMVAHSSMFVGTITTTGKAERVTDALSPILKIDIDWMEVLLLSREKMGDDPSELLQDVLKRIKL